MIEYASALPGLGNRTLSELLVQEVASSALTVVIWNMVGVDERRVTPLAIGNRRQKSRVLAVGSIPGPCSVRARQTLEEIEQKSVIAACRLLFYVDQFDFFAHLCVRAKSQETESHPSMLLLRRNTLVRTSSVFPRWLLPLESCPRPVHFCLLQGLPTC